MKKILFLILIGLVVAINCNCLPIGTFNKDLDIKEGDIVFQISKSNQSPFVQLATLSPWSHCGIIVYKNGEPYVLEASNVVKLTDLNTWINKGRGYTWKSKRIINNCPKIQYKKYLGQSYDLAFKFNNGKMYCSELVYTIYKEQFGIELCKPKKVSSYHIFGLGKILKKRHINPNQLVVAPSDLL